LDSSFSPDPLGSDLIVGFSFSLSFPARQASCVTFFITFLAVNLSRSSEWLYWDFVDLNSFASASDGKYTSLFFLLELERD
jgi:hypothetical protein